MQTIAFIVEEEKGVILAERASERPAKIVLFFVSLGSDTGVCQSAVRVKHGIFVVFKKRPMKAIGS